MESRICVGEDMSKVLAVKAVITLPYLMESGVTSLSWPIKEGSIHSMMG